MLVVGYVSYQSSKPGCATSNSFSVP